MTLAERQEHRTSATARRRTASPRRLGRDSHSRFVGIAKVILPAIAVGLLLLIVVWSRYDPREQGLKLSLSEATLEDASSSTMLRPRFGGVDEKGQPFAVTAERALQTTPDAPLIELEAPRGDLTTQDNGWVSLSAERGTYDRTRRTLELSGDVALFHDSGLEMHSESAEMDLEAGRARGDSPVEGSGPSGRITSQGFRIEERGGAIVFTGPARLVLTPKGDGRP